MMDPDAAECKANAPNLAAVVKPRVAPRPSRRPADKA